MFVLFNSNTTSVTSEQKLLTLPEHTGSTLFLVRFMLLNLQFSVQYFEDHWLPFCPFYIGHSIVCPSIYPFVILNLFVQRFCKYLFYIWSTPLTISLAGGKIQYNKQYLVQSAVNNVTTRYKKLYVRVLCGITSIKNIIVTHKRDIIQ